MFSAKLLWEYFPTGNPMRQLDPNLFFLMCVSNIFLLSAACVEKPFSRMKLVKTCLRTQLSQVRLHQLLRIGRELLKDDYNNVYEYLIDKLLKRNLNMHIEL